MERELWEITEPKLFGLINNLFFSGLWTSLSMENVAHESKKNLIGKDYEHIKNICKL